MTLQLCEPAPSLPGQPDAGVCPDVSFAQSGFHYIEPMAATQQRTLALVRPGTGEDGFYFDVFRSRTDQVDSDSGGQFHDYLYHDLGTSLSFEDGQGQLIKLSDSNQLDPTGSYLKGYSYFENERSMSAAGNWHAQFDLNIAKVHQQMNLWMPGQGMRTVFAVDAPPDHEARSNPRLKLTDLPMPTVIVRQQGDAWDAPFVAVYQPDAKEAGSAIGSAIRSVEAVKLSERDSSLAACVARGKSGGWSALLMQDDRSDRLHSGVGGADFQGSFGEVTFRSGQPDQAAHPDRATQLYLSSGTLLRAGPESLQAVAGDAGKPAMASNAALWVDDKGWRYSATRPIRVSVEFAKPMEGISLGRLAVRCGEGETTKPVAAEFGEVNGDANHLIATMTLPAGQAQLLELNASGAK